MGLVMVKIITQTSTYPGNIKGHFAGAIFTGNGRNLTRVKDGKHQGSVHISIDSSSWGKGENHFAMEVFNIYSLGIAWSNQPPRHFSSSCPTPLLSMVMFKDPPNSVALNLNLPVISYEKERKK